MKEVRAFSFVAVVVILCTLGMSQTTAGRFEVADIHPSPRGMDLRMEAVYRRGGRYELQNATMVDLIQTAYGVDPDNVVGGPDWLEYDRFGVIAKVPYNTPAKNLNAMLQSLLADRFGLIVHNDMKPISRFVLARGSGIPKMKPARLETKQAAKRSLALSMLLAMDSL